MTKTKPCDCCVGTMLAGQIKNGMVHRGQRIEGIRESTAFGVVVVAWGKQTFEADEVVHHIKAAA